MTTNTNKTHKVITYRGNRTGADLREDVSILVSGSTMAELTECLNRKQDELRATGLRNLVWLGSRAAYDSEIATP